MMLLCGKGDNMEMPDLEFSVKVNDMDIAIKTGELVTSILSWWEEHRYDSSCDGDGDEHNTYDEEPDFVTKSKYIKENIKINCVQHKPSACMGITDEYDEQR
jgi:hypothetical protein